MPAVCFPMLGVMRASEVAPVYMRDLVMLFIGAFIIAVFLIPLLGIQKASLVIGLLNFIVVLIIFVKKRDINKYVSSIFF